MPHEPTVLTRRDGRIGRILLNRPNALNALDLPMIRAVREALEIWREQPSVHAVVIEGAGDRAFCAGGDIRAIRGHVLAGEYDVVETFFAEEYALNEAIAEYPKPYVALIDGVCMGGGIGVSVHGAIRVATEAALLAMPETAIGMFPDVGASYFLPRLPSCLGMFLALTGTRMQGADAVHAGLATHYVPKAELPELSAALARDGVAVVPRFAAPLPPFSLGALRDEIDHCFGADGAAGQETQTPSLPGLTRQSRGSAAEMPGSRPGMTDSSGFRSSEAHTGVQEIVRRLEAEDSGWSREVLANLRRMSPAALHWSFEIVHRGAGRTLRQCLAAELALTRHVTRHPDYLEGVRAMVVDKDRKPRWSAARIEDVDPAEIAAMFS